MWAGDEASLVPRPRGRRERGLGMRLITASEVISEAVMTTGIKHDTGKVYRNV